MFWGVVDKGGGGPLEGTIVTNYREQMAGATERYSHLSKQLAPFSSSRKKERGEFNFFFLN